MKKRLLLMCFATLLGMVGIRAASYKLWISGAQVTDANCNSIMPGVKFTPSTNTLTLNGANYGAAPGTSAIKSQIDNLKVVVNGTNYISSDDYVCFESYGAKTTFSGTGTLNMYGATNYYCFSGNSTSDIAFEGGVKIIGQRYGSFLRGVRNLEFTNCTVQGNMGDNKRAFYDVNGTITFNSSYNMRCVEHYNAGKVNDGSVDGLGYNNGTQNVLVRGKFTIASTYGFSVNDVCAWSGNASNVLGDGKVSYNSTSNAVTFKSATINAKGVPAFRNFGNNGLEVNFDGKNTFSSEKYNTFIIAATTLLNSGVNSSVDINTPSDYRVFYFSGDYTMAINANINCQGARLFYSSNNKGTVYVQGGLVKFKSLGNYTPSTIGSLVLQNGIKMITPENGTIDNGKIKVNGAEYIGDLHFEKGYGLKVSGVNVIESNASDVLGDGTVIYSPGTKTLTLKSANISSMTNSEVDGLIVSLKGENQSGEFNTYKNTTIKSASGNDGKLNFNKGGFSGIHGYNAPTLTIRNCRVNIGTPTYGINGNGDMKLVVEYAELISSAANAAIFNLGSLTLNNVGYVEPTTAPTLNGGTLVDSSNNRVKKVHISTVQGITLSGTHVTTFNASDILGDGKASYNASSKTLTLKEGTYSGLKNLEVDGFTLAWSGTVKMTAQVTLTKTSFLRADNYKDVLDIYAKTGAALYANGTGDLTISRGVVKAVSEAASGVVGRNNNNLYVSSNGTLLARSLHPNSTSSLNSFNTITYASGLGLYPSYLKIGKAGGDSGESVLEPDGTKTIGNVMIGAAYGAGVAGHYPVLGLNVDDVLLDGGSVSYDSGSNILTLKNANIVNKYDGNAIDMKSDNAKLVLDGKNTITNEAKGHGIYGRDGLTITGKNSASLKITSQGTVDTDMPIAIGKGKLNVSDMIIDVTHPRFVFGGASSSEPVNVSLANLNIKGAIEYDSKATVANAENVGIANVISDLPQPFMNDATASKTFTLKVTGDNVIKYGKRGIAIDGDNSKLKIYGSNKSSSKLTLTSETASSGLYIKKAAEIENVNLTVTAQNYGFFGHTSSPEVDLTITDSRAEFNGGSDAIYKVKNLTLNGNMNLIEPMGGKFNATNGDIQIGDVTAKKVIFDNYDPIDYSLKVAGVNVTSLNATDVLGNGKVKYDATTNTLTLGSNFIITNTTPGAAISYTGTEPLFTINISGGTVGIDNGSIVGNGIESATDMLIKSEDKNELNIYANTANANQKPIAMLNGNKLTIENIKITTYDPHTSIGGVSDAAPATVELKKSSLTANIELDEPYKYENAAINNVKDITVESSILELYGKSYNSFIYTKDNLNIDVKGNHNDWSAYNAGSDKVNGIVLDGNNEASLTINGEDPETSEIYITGRHDGIYVIGKNKTINIQNVNAKISGNYAGIIGSETNYALNIKNSYGLLWGGFSGIALDNAKPMVLDNVDITTPNAVYEPTSGKYIVGTDIVSMLTFEVHKAKFYGIYVENQNTSDITEITSDNLSFSDGTGSISYNPETNVLTLDNANLSSYVLTTNAYPAVNPVINVVGENRFSGIITSSSRIYGDGILSLNINYPSMAKGSKSLLYVPALMAGEDITIEGISLVCVGESSILAKKNVKFQNVNASLKGIFYVDGNLSFDGCSIVQPQGYVMDEGVMKVDGTAYTGEVIISTAITYDLKVKGANVTSITAGDILGDGTMYYDETNKKLVMNNVDADWAGANHMLIESAIDGLTVEVTGDNKIKGAGIKFDKNTVMLGTGSLTITQGNLEGSAAIETASVLTIKNITLNAQGSNVGLRGPGAFVFSNVIASIKGGLKNVINVADISLDGCGYELPADGLYNISDMRMDDFNGNAYNGEIKIRPFTSYSLYIMGSRVTDINCNDILHDGGKVKYDDASKTLTLTDFQETVENTFLESFEDLNIVVNGTNELRASKLVFNASALITGTGKLAVTSANDAIVVNSGMLTIRDANLSVGGANGIVGTGASTYLTIDNSNVAISTATGKAMSGFALCDIVNCATTKNSFYDVMDDVLKNAKGEVMSDAVFAPATVYDAGYENVEKNIFINLNSLNAADLLEDGTVSVDVATDTFTLNNCNRPEIALDALYKLGINVNGTNNLAGLVSATYIDIKGNGTLNIDDNVAAACGILFDVELDIENATVNVKSIDKGINSVSSSGIVSIKNAHVTAQGDNGSICGIDFLNLDGVVIAQPDGAAYDSWLKGVAVAGSITTDEVKIIPESEYDGIENITVDGADAKRYDVTGRQVRDSYRGIIISNGKKYVKK